MASRLVAAALWPLNTVLSARPNSPLSFDTRPGLLVHGPPTNPGHAVLDGGVADTRALPVRDQGGDVLGFSDPAPGSW